MYLVSGSFLRSIHMLPILQSGFLHQPLAAESSVCLSGDNLEEIYELLEGFLGDDIDFIKKVDAVTSAEEIDDKKKVFKYTMCGKECISPEGLKRHTTLKHVQEEVIPKEQKKCLSPWMNL